MLSPSIVGTLSSGSSAPPDGLAGYESNKVGQGGGGGKGRRPDKSAAASLEEPAVNHPV